MPLPGQQRGMRAMDALGQGELTVGAGRATGLIFPIFTLADLATTAIQGVI